MNANVLFVYLIIIWTIVYCTYKKCLNAHFRSLGYALIRRNRVCNVIWTLGFNIITNLFSTFLWESVLKSELSIIILKSFYVHYSGILMFSNHWLEGISNLLFMLFIFENNRPNLRPPLINILFLKSIDVLILEMCRMLYLKWPKKFKQIYSKILCVIYCIFWTYLYVIYIPINWLLPYKYQSLHEKIFLYLWLCSQYLNFISCALKKNFKTGKILEQFLFPSLSTESIHLTKIFNSYREMKHTKTSDTSVIKKELWQTLFCAMTIKKKINRLRKLKQIKTKI